MEEDEAKKRGIDLEKLKKEQKKLAKSIQLKDNIDFSLAERITGISNVFSGNIIFCGIIVMNPSLEIIEQQYHSEKTSFPYIPGFRAYRELPCMIQTIEKLEDKPDIIFVPGHGISHPRLGLASHLSIATGIPVIGVAKSLIEGEQQGDDIILNGKKVGTVVKLKEKSAPIYISPGNLITIKTAVELAKKFSTYHKLPEPLYQAHRYANRIMKEISSKN
jgi:deoxyribonuclease V